MEECAMSSSVAPVLWIGRVSGLYPLDDRLNVSPLWTLFSLALISLLSANAYFFYNYIETFYGFAGTMYIGLCLTLSISTILLAILSFRLPVLYKKFLSAVNDVEHFFFQLNIQLKYDNKIILYDILFRLVAIAVACLLNFQTYSGNHLQLYMRLVGLYLTQWCISCVEIHIVAISFHIAELFKSLRTALPSSNFEYFLEASSNLVEISEGFHVLFTKQAFVACAVLFFCSTLDVYFLFIVIQESDRKSTVQLFTLFRSLGRSYQLWRLVSSIEQLFEQANRLDEEIYTTALEDTTNQLANKEKLLLYFAMKQKVKFSACGFFSVDYTLVHSIVVAVTNYLVILLQFGSFPYKPPG